MKTRCEDIEPPFYFVIHSELLWLDQVWESVKKYLGRKTLWMICYDSFRIPSMYDNELIERIEEIKSSGDQIGFHSHCLFPYAIKTPIMCKIKTEKIILDESFNRLKKETELESFDHFLPGHWIYSQDTINWCNDHGFKYFHVAVPPVKGHSLFLSSSLDNPFQIPYRGDPQKSMNGMTLKCCYSVEMCQRESCMIMNFVEKSGEVVYN